MFDNRWDHWASDFADSFAAQQFAGATRESLGSILQVFGDAARRLDRQFPDEIEAGTIRQVLTDHLSRMSLAVVVRAEVPEVMAQFFEFLQDTGRHGAGYSAATMIRETGMPMLSDQPKAVAPATRSVPIRKANAMPVGRNDPCPCGSGKKYKKCCWAG